MQIISKKFIFNGIFLKKIRNFAPGFRIERSMKLRYYNMELSHINPINAFHKWGVSCQH